MNRPTFIQAFALTLRCIPLYSLAIFLFVTAAQAQNSGVVYAKSAFYIPMRDGVRLYTVVYQPQNKSRTYPILLERTPYDANMSPISPSNELRNSGYIFVHQDVRGMNHSEGDFVNIRPLLPTHHTHKRIDESTDAYDTIDYLIKHLPRNNRRVGMWGISYPGFYADCGAICGHPALIAVSPQAPLTDWFTGDDEHHNGAFYLMDNFAWEWTDAFDLPRNYPKQPRHAFPPNQGGYSFYLQMGPLKNANDRYLKNTIPYWNELMEHPNYDAYWKVRNLNPHLRAVKPALLVTGGLFDCEDFYGTLATYQSVGKQSPKTNRYLALGPWCHGCWAEGDGSAFGGLNFGSKTAEFYRAKIEFPFFEHFLKGIGDAPSPKSRAQIFDTGANQWRTFDAWPPRKIKSRSLYLASAHALAFTAASKVPSVADNYTSDPANPVPYSDQADKQSDRYTLYMAENQHFVDARADVLTYRSPDLDGDLTVVGPIPVDLSISTTGTDADFVVKIIDVYPLTDADHPGAEILVRADVMRGRFRNSLSKPQPFTPGVVTPVHFNLPDICHTFRKGHRIAVQIQSSWFPIVDRNPQTFVDIYRASESDFRKAEMKVWRGGKGGSKVVLGVLGP